MNYPSSQFITGKLPSEKCGRFVDARKQNRIRFYDNMNSITDTMLAYGLYQTSLLYGYMTLFDICYEHVNKEYEISNKDNPFFACLHSSYCRDDGILYAFMFLTHHITELILKTVFCDVFGSCRTFTDRNGKDRSLNNSHFTKDIWEYVKKQVCADFPEQSDRLCYFDKFFANKDEVCPDGFSGRYYHNNKFDNNKFDAYLPCTYFIDILSIYGTVHKLYDTLCNGPKSIGSLYKNNY